MTQPSTLANAPERFARVMETVTALVEDLRLTHVARYKAAHPGHLAIGTLPVYAPRPLFEAIDCLPVALYGGGDSVDIIRGDSYFQSYICHIPRSTIELGLNGSYDPLDGVVFPSTCDVIRNLSGMWKLLFPHQFSSYLDLPQTFDADRGGVFYAGELRRIAKDLQGRGARALEPDRLWAAIARENRRRAALEKLDALRRAEPWRLRASEAYLVARAGGLLTADAHTQLIEDFLAAATERETRRYDNVRVVMVGAFCEQLPMGLIRSLEQAGCDIVDDDFQLSLRLIEGSIPASPAELRTMNLGQLDAEDPLNALAMAFLRRGVATATRYIGEGEKGRALIDRVRACQADGVIFSGASFCDPALLDEPMMETALDAAKIPHTSFKFAENSGQFQAIREQAGAFSDSVKLWGTAA
jgi:benzoyl-CoA reductase subunit C